MFLPIGSIIPYAGIIGSANAPSSNNVPNGFADTTSPLYEKKLEQKGWLICDGSVVSVAGYPQLFLAIGFVYGKKDEGHFYLPDYRGQFLRGVNYTAEDSSSGTTVDPDANTRVSNGHTMAWSGNMVGSLQADALQDHVHPYDKPVTGGLSGKDGTLYGAVDTSAKTGDPVSPTAESADAVRVSSETRSKNTYVNYLILSKYL